MKTKLNKQKTKKQQFKQNNLINFATKQRLYGSH